VRLHLSAIFLFALLSAACAAPQAGPPLDSVPALRESVSYETYAVDGSSPGEVRAALDRLGPVAEDGRQYDALTSWSLTWSFSFNQRKDSCSLASATIEVRSVVTLPELVSESLDARARRRWDSYLAALARNASSNSAASLQRPDASGHGLAGKCLTV
jgi:predicted secreted Zn-dependent protease